LSTKTNLRVADRLREAAELLDQQGANPFRGQAYRRAADTLEHLHRDVGGMAEREGGEALEALPGIGKGIARAIRELVQTGRWAQLERLRGGADPVVLFGAVPGIGPGLARRIHDHLHVDSLEALEAAAADGRLEAVPGLGPRRIAAVRASLGAMLGRPGRSGGQHAPEATPPPVNMLLAVDNEYRQLSAGDRLPRIAPRRFNPAHDAWLPVWHTERGEWHLTVLFSNTARAHELGHTRDWVVIVAYDEDHHEHQCTVVTEKRGRLTGKRVIRGREAECLEHYEGAGTVAPGPGT
jgi:hypothetical protein